MMTNLERVLIIDDSAVQSLQAQANIPLLEYRGKGHQEEYSQKAADIAAEMEGKTAFNLTESYRNAGGDKDKEIIVAAQPKVPVTQNHLYDNEAWEEIAQHAIDYDQAIADIEQVNPDKTLLDLQFGAPVPPEIQEEYVQREREAESFRPQVKGSPDMSEGKLTYNSPKAGPQFPIRTKLEHRTPAAENHQRRKEQLFSRPSGRSPVHAGGAVLGYRMQRDGKDFSLWTNDVGHGEDGIRAAYILGLVSEEDVRSLYDDSMKFGPGASQDGYLRDEDIEKYGIRTYEARASDNRNIIAYEKDLIDTEADPSGNSRLADGAVSGLKQVIELAEDYQ